MERHCGLAIVYRHTCSVYVGLETVKLLFLDIDGVVNSYRTKQRFGGFIGIDPELAAKVKRIINETGCKVVLSSTWRLDEKSQNHVKEKVCNFIDVTPAFPGLAIRGTEVKHWIDHHPEVFGEKVTRYAILDDNDDFIDGQPLFLTRFATGITDDVADAVIKYLGCLHNQVDVPIFENDPPIKLTGFCVVCRATVEQTKTGWRDILEATNA